MKKLIVASLIVVFQAGTVVAKLGETKEEIVARFGEGNLSERQRQVGAETYKYFKNGFQIEVVISAGKSIWELYHKQQAPGAFPDADIENLLDSYKEPKDPKEAKRTWHFDRKENRWESSGKPKYIAYRHPGHGDFFSIKDLAACEALDKAAPGSKGL